MRYSDFMYNVDEGVATVRLDNPDKLNALSFQTYEGLERLTKDLAQDDTVKVLVFTGTGRGFCSGGSVQDIIGKKIRLLLCLTESNILPAVFLTVRLIPRKVTLWSRLIASAEVKTVHGVELLQYHSPSTQSKPRFVGGVSNGLLEGEERPK